MKGNNVIIYISYKIIFSCVLLFFININNPNIRINSYLIFPLEYLPNQNYKFIKENNFNSITPEEIIQQIYYKNILTKIEIGTPLKKIILILETNSDKFYLSNFNSSKNGKDENFYQFKENDFFNESLSSTNINMTCEKTNFYPYNIICQIKDVINFNINNTIYSKEFQIKLMKNNENIPGYIGLLYNDSNYEFTKGFITELKAAKLIDNYYWFFDFDEFFPLEKKLKGKFIIGGLPHKIYPNKYSFDYFESTSSAETYLPTGRAWRLNVNKIYIDNEQENNIILSNKIITLQYEIYNIISSMEFHFEIRDLLMDELVKEGKCFSSSFSQNLYSDNNLTFYYCNKSVKNILYEKLPNLKFSSVELDYVFELTKEDLFHEKGDYIYFMILFTKFESNTLWIMGQIFLSKYNFVFNSDKKQIGFYKKVNKGENKEDKNDKENKEIYNNTKKNNFPNKLIIVFIILGVALVFSLIGVAVGKKIFGWRRKIIANELTDELDYEYKTKDDNNYNPDDNMEIGYTNKDNKKDNYGIKGNSIN